MFDRAIFGEALISLRGNRSQRHVARSAGIPVGTLCQWERGKRSPRDNQIPKILNALDCSEDRLRLEVCRIQIKRLQIKGSALDDSTFEVIEDHRPELARCSTVHLDQAPREVRVTVNRLQDGIHQVSKQLIQLQSDLEAVMLAVEKNSRQHTLRANEADRGFAQVT